jgi:hypothetical protein
MSPVRLYAVVFEAPASSLGIGAEGEPLRAVSCGAVVALAGELARPPAVTADALKRYDETVRRLADLVDPLLPARFGEVVADEAALCRALEPRGAELAAALARVAGCVQMTLRVFGDTNSGGEREPRGTAVAELPDAGGADASVPALPGAVVEALAGPGTRYLLERLQAVERERSLPEIAGLRAALAPLVRAERVERHAAGRLLATAYDLVARGDVERYTALVREAAGRPGAPRLTLSGPWPPYAFAVGSPPELAVPARRSAAG